MSGKKRGRDSPLLQGSLKRAAATLRDADEAAKLSITSVPNAATVGAQEEMYVALEVDFTGLPEGTKLADFVSYEVFVSYSICHLRPAAAEGDRTLVASSVFSLFTPLLAGHGDKQTKAAAG
jgi:hypothetical protein